MLTLKVLGIVGLLSLIVAYSSIALSISISPWFSWVENALSDLGARSPSSPLFNAGLIVSSALALMFAMGLRRVYRGALGAAGTVLYALSAVSLFMIGFFPETAGVVHYYSSVAFFVLVALTLVTFGAYGLAYRPRSTKTGITVLILSALAVAIWLLPWKGVAIPELFSSLTISAWTVIASVRMLRARGQ